MTLSYLTRLSRTWRLLAYAALALSIGCTTVALQPSSYSVTENQVYVTRNGKPLTADLYIPNGPGPFPGVVVIHGGGWYKGEKGDMSTIARVLAENGFTVINISYRLAPDHKFPAQLYDSKEAVRWMRRNTSLLKLDPERIGAFGYSAGAHLAMMLALTDADDKLEGPSEGELVSSRIQAVVAGGTPVDLLAFSENKTLYDFLGDYKGKIPNAYRQASPINYVSSDDPPTFLYHGRFDWVVDVEQSRRMVEALEQANVPVEYSEVILGHVATFLLNDDEVQKGVDFLIRELKNKK